MCFIVFGGRWWFEWVRVEGTRKGACGRRGVRRRRVVRRWVSDGRLLLLVAVVLVSVYILYTI